MDLYCEWGGDLVLSPSGGVQTATGWDQVRQRILRSLITSGDTVLPDGSSSPAGYVFHPTYGLGLGVLVSQNQTPAMLAELQSRIRAAVLEDASVDPSFQPQVVFRQPTTTCLEVYVGCLLLSGAPVSFGVSLG